MTLRRTAWLTATTVAVSLLLIAFGRRIQTGGTR